jgi:hypothetical protein
VLQHRGLLGAQPVEYPGTDRMKLSEREYLVEVWQVAILVGPPFFSYQRHLNKRGK